MTLKRLGVASVVIGLVVAGFFVWRLVAILSGAPQGISSGPVELEKEGLTVWATSEVTVDCTARDSSGAEVALRNPGGSLRISHAGHDWYAVADSAVKVPAGRYTVECTAEPGTRFGVTPRVTGTDLVLTILGAIGSLLVFGVLGAVLVALGLRTPRPAGPPFPPPPGHTFPPR